jgi:hypothetical protein
VLALLVASSAVVACFEQDSCEDQRSFVGVRLPPMKAIPLEELDPDSGFTLVTDAGPDASPNAPVWVVNGTREEWLAMPCEDACRRLRRDRVTDSTKAFKSCHVEPATGDGGPLLVCDYRARTCTDYQY